jgi:antirestriction protein
MEDSGWWGFLHARRTGSQWAGELNTDGNVDISFLPAVTVRCLALCSGWKDCRGGFSAIWEVNHASASGV